MKKGSLRMKKSAIRIRNTGKSFTKNPFPHRKASIATKKEFTGITKYASSPMARGNFKP